MSGRARTMTWQEFKEYVEEKMAKYSIEHDWPIWIIAVLNPVEDDLVVTCDEDGRMMIVETLPAPPGEQEEE